MSTGHPTEHPPERGPIEPQHRGLTEVCERGRAAACLQCHKCTAGCPVADSMDLPPSAVVRLVQLGAAQPLLDSRSIWLCASCHTCTTRCPAGVDLAAMQDELRRCCLREGGEPGEPRAAAAHRAALATVARSGRLNEIEFVLRYKAATGRWLEDAPLGLAMLRRGKLPLRPQRAGTRRSVSRAIRTACHRGGRDD